MKWLFSAEGIPKEGCQPTTTPHPYAPMARGQHSTAPMMGYDPEVVQTPCTYISLSRMSRMATTTAKEAGKYSL